MIETIQVRTIHIVAVQGQRPVVTAELPSPPYAHQDFSAVGASLVVGDAQDDTGDATTYLGHAARVRWNSADEVEAVTSLTGFPPVYCYRADNMVIISSSIKAIADTPGVTLQYDLRGVAEWVHIGKPISHRTLFRNVEVIPAGTTVRVSSTAKLTHTDTWEAPHDRHFESYDAYLEAQAEAFRDAVSRIDVAASFLSLTAGLDTRAVLATLAQQGRVIDAVTISGKSNSLDARRARDLCSALGMRHVIVRQDDGFLKVLEDRTRDSVTLSGGISGFDGSLDVHMYRTMAASHGARLSGNLGNQVGRSGTEGAGIRALSPDWFSNSVQSAIRSLPTTHWHRQITGGAELGASSLIQQESLFASLGNASIGSALAIQQTPYADRRVIENKYAEPANPNQHVGSTSSVRMRDIRHRVLGEPVSKSFQRRVVNGNGGPAATLPINWGWRPKGGVSLTGLVTGAGAVMDAVLSRSARGRSALRAVSTVVGIQGLSGFASQPVWRSAQAKEFMRDELASSQARTHPLLAGERISKALLARDLPDDVAAATAHLLTLVLASREFGVSDVSA